MLKKFILTVASLVALLSFIKHCDFGFDQRMQKAVKRVETVLGGITQKDGYSAHDEQLALCRWWKDVYLITDMGEMNGASNAFDRWRMRGNIFPTIGQFKITGAKRLDNPKQFIAIVSGTIDGRHFSMRVPEHDTISWFDIP